MNLTMIRLSVTMAGCLLLTAALHAYDAKPAATADTAASTRQYTFAWKFVDGDAMAPRGGNTIGAPIVLAPTPTPAWQALQAAEGSDKDRAAILAMAGEYRVSFDFIEVAGFTNDFKPSKPYQSWGTEKVYVIENRPGFISLQHILVMHIAGAVNDAKPAPDTKPETDAKPAPQAIYQTMVTKHWRQDWQFQPSAQIVYLGPHRWQQIPVSQAAAAGSWSQTVYQVDDSPRYSGIGRWLHSANYSSWQGSEGLRPLPRREWSVRADYQALLGTNRHTITPSGWVQEEQNNKVALDTDGSLRSDQPVLSREYGFNRYEAIVDSDFSAGDRYIEKTAMLWQAVRQNWAARLATGDRIRLKAAPDQGALFMPLFERAETIQPDSDPKKLKVEVNTLIDAYIAN
jgi:hypothetical protein